jgi:tetratricopeptide (TPR) repeat protein
MRVASLATVRVVLVRAPPFPQQPDPPPSPTPPQTQVGRSLALLGKHRQAVEVYDEALRLAPGDWELWHGKGSCLARLADCEQA